jgi:UDP-3-O-[3-hydroxymyristoyl] glucosamine N-acyltransferase
MSKILIVFGDRTADEMIAAFRRTSLAATFDRVEKLFYQRGKSVGPLEDTARDYRDVYYQVGVVDEYLRVEIADLATRLGWQPWTIVDPLAYVDPSAEIGPGCFIAAHAVVSSRARLGPHGLVHFQALVGHDAVLGAHCILLPGAKVSGGVVMGERCLVGSNGFIAANSVLGDRVKVDALSYAQGSVVGGTVISSRRPTRLGSP